jgi:hypothetical protein
LISRILSFDWALLFFWLMATALGWVLGGAVFPGLGFVTTGLAVGIFQSLVLQGRIRKPWRWVLATTAGMAAGNLIVLFAIPPQFGIVDGVVIGLTTGMAQWLVLRREVQWAGWWIAFSLIGWTTGLTFFPGFMLPGVMAGILTGLALEILLRNPKPKTASDQTPSLDQPGRNAS